MVTTGCLEWLAMQPVVNGHIANHLQEKVSLFDVDR